LTAKHCHCGTLATKAPAKKAAPKKEEEEMHTQAPTEEVMPDDIPF
jgi:hypothetical protein